MGYFLLENFCKSGFRIDYVHALSCISQVKPRPWKGRTTKTMMVWMREKTRRMKIINQR